MFMVMLLSTKVTVKDKKIICIAVATDRRAKGGGGCDFGEGDPQLLL